MSPKGKHHAIRVSAALLLVLLLVKASVAHANDDDRAELDEGVALLGIFIGEEEKDATDVILEAGKFLLPAEETFNAINTRFRNESDGTFLDTPIGSIEIPANSLREVDGQNFVSEDFLLETLSVPLRFDVEFYAIVLTPPWNSDAPLSASKTDEPEREPDVAPPIIGLTSAHGDVFTTYSDTSDEVGVSTRLELNGHALGGVWQLGYSGDLDSHSLTDYAWLREVADNIWTLVGRQQSGIHPLIDVVDMTGAQVAYSNRADAFEQIEDVNGALLDRGNGSGRIFVGEGPPGGRAELVIDGLIVAEAIIGVDGTYTVESPLFDQRRNDVEVRIFEPLSNNQVDSVRTTVSANNFLAPKGSFNIVAGAGAEGSIFDDEKSRGATGFARTRYAPLDDFTVEAGLAFDPDDGLSGVVGAAAGLGEFGTAYAAASLSESGEKGFEGLYFAEFKKFSLNARFNYRENNDAEAGEPDTVENHFIEAAYDYSQDLLFGAIARRNIEATFVLPFISWRAPGGVSLSARPNLEGTYRLEARAEPFENINLQVFYEGEGFARVAYDFYTELTGDGELSLEAIYDEDDDSLGFAVGIQGHRLFGTHIFWQLRGERQKTNTVLSAGLRHELRPGVSVFADSGFRKFDGGSTELFGSLGLTFDVGFTGDTLAAAPRQATNPRLGRIAGRVVVPDSFELLDGDLEGAQIIIDGKPAGRVEADGSYWLPRVPKGVSSVRLEADNLPIDLVVDSDTIQARVAPGAVTPVNFELAVEVGTAGRIIGPDNEPVAGVPLQMLNAEGIVVSRARSNQFGLFRMDGLRPGTYILQALDKWEGASREVIIKGEYVFGTDLKVDKSGDAQPVQKTVTEL